MPKKRQETKAETPLDKARAVFGEQGGTLRTSKALELRIHPRTLYAMLNQGVIVRLSRGLYRLADLPALGNPDLILVTSKSPNGVICLVSALAYHDLTTQIPHEVHLALPRGAEPPRLEHPPLRIFWFTGQAFTAGIETHTHDGVEVQIYSPEKTLADCFKYRNKLGLDVAVEALRLYREHRSVRASELLRFARICRVERVMRPYLEALLSEGGRGDRGGRGSITNLPASIRQRLLNRARETGESFNHLLQHFALERFLYRLSRSRYADQFVLKGALMFTVWQIPKSRPTLDIDLLGHADNGVEEMVALIRAVCRQPVEDDGMWFDPETVVGKRIVENADYGGVRLRFRGTLGNAVVAMQVDVGFGDAVVPAAEMTEYPSLLDLPTPRLRGYSKESTVAEKFHALASRGLVSSRMKDFHDIWELSRWFDFDGATLSEAVDTAFARRGTPLEAEPEALSATFAKDPTKVVQWKAFQRRAGGSRNLPEVVADLATFLGPIAEALSQGRPFGGRWEAPGPWKSSRRRR